MLVAARLCASTMMINAATRVENMVKMLMPLASPTTSYILVLLIGRHVAQYSTFIALPLHGKRVHYSADTLDILIARDSFRHGRSALKGNLQACVEYLHLNSIFHQLKRGLR